MQGSPPVVVILAFVGICAGCYALKSAPTLINDVRTYTLGNLGHRFYRTRVVPALLKKKASPNVWARIVQARKPVQ